MPKRKSQLHLQTTMKNKKNRGEWDMSQVQKSTHKTGAEKKG